jgi:hypothetical protein
MTVDAGLACIDTLTGEDEALPAPAPVLALPMLMAFINADE